MTFGIQPSSFRLQAGRIYTIGCKLKISGSVKPINVNIYHSELDKNNYLTQYSKDTFKQIVRTNSSGQMRYTLWFGAANSSAGQNIAGQTIHIEMWEPYVVEGAYYNPPYFDSLDSQLNNQFLYKNTDFPNHSAGYISSNMYSRAKWLTNQSTSAYKQFLVAGFSKGTGTKKLVFHQTQYGSGNNDSNIFIGNFMIGYVTATNAERSYCLAYDFAYKFFGVNDLIANQYGALKELYVSKPTNGTLPTIGYRLCGGKIQELYLEFPDNYTAYGGKIYLEYTIVSDYGRFGTNNDYHFVPYIE